MLPISEWPRLNLAEEVPPLVDVAMFLNRLPDDSSKELFFRAHCWTLKMIVDSWQLPGSAEQNDLIGALCDRLGFDRLKVWTAMTGRQYYQHVYSRVVTNLRAVHDLTENPESLNSSVGSLIQRHQTEAQRMRAEFPGYRKFSMVFDGFVLAWTQAEDSGDQVVIALSRQLQALNAELSKTDWKTISASPGKRFRLVECPFCHAYFRFENKPGVSISPPHCGAEFCRKAYDRLKPSKQDRTLIPSGWVKVHARKQCSGPCCRERVNLNSDLLCKKCFSEAVSQ